MSESTRNLVAFWILGLCNNFAYVIMLSAAKDILEAGQDHPPPTNGTTPVDQCVTDPSEFSCSPISTGSILLADILPTLFVKLIGPFTLTRVPYGVRHCFVVFLQSCSYVIVALSGSITVGIIGVVFASLGAGLGEITYLSLASHFHGDIITAWSSGTGGAGLFGALTYAILTDKRLIGLSPRVTLFIMLIIPLFFAFAFWKLLQSPSTVKKFNIRRPILVESRSTDHLSDDEQDTVEPLLAPDSSSSDIPVRQLTFFQTLSLTKPLIKFMIPLAFVYFGEYFINQGLVELIEFDCSHGFGLSKLSQYRWYQVTYQLGVFISRSSAKVFPIHATFLPIFGVLQMINAVIFFRDAMFRFIPHISIIFLMILYEGLLGGGAYVNTFRAVHKTITGSTREFSMSFVSISDSIGIVLAGLLAIPAHNYICVHREN
ncbi:hypothetical protein FO519_008649 [Halicephalobus sp. NKZ332]|nr:hypothetical protein FO519_008649 [Halicephalobus sp. NKZ332]